MTQKDAEKTFQQNLPPLTAPTQQVQIVLQIENQYSNQFQTNIRNLCDEHFVVNPCRRIS